jgi:hypothetical protein
LGEAGSSAAPHPTGRYPENNGLVTAGYICAILIPFIGAIIGIVLMSRRDSRGGGVLILSAVVFVIALVVLSNSPSYY